MEFKKKDLILKEDKSEEGVIQKVLSKLKGIRDRAKSEVEETRALVRILTHAVRSYSKTREFDLDEKDREFIKGQSGDVVKNIILMVISIIPIPIPITPFLVLFGKKVGIDFIPKQQDIPEKGKKKEKLDENKHFNYIMEQINDGDKKEDFIYYLCNQATKRKLKSSPFCDLKTYYDQTPAKEKVLSAILTIHKFLVEGTHGLNRGAFPRLVRIALNTEDPAQTLYIIAEFINDKTYDKDETKIKLKKYKGKDYAPLNLDDFLTVIRSKEYSQYEDSLTKNELKLTRTVLQLEYNCTDDIDMTLIKLLEVIKKSDDDKKYEKFNEIFTKVTDCLYSFMNSDDKVIKADALYDLESPMMYDGKPVIVPGDYIEIKKMDPEVDSYLSEFFSIFKQSKLAKTKKKDYIILYNYFVDMLFEWILTNGEVYRQKVLDGMSGIIYDKNVFVPRDQIDVYWSNKGQRGCDERRLSLRFRLKPGLKNMVGYVYEPGKGVDSLTKTEVRDLPQEFKERNVCRNVHFNLLDYDKEYKSKDVTEGKKPIKFIVTDGQFKDLMKYINENVKFRKIR
jgi:hypothetical protein